MAYISRGTPPRGKGEISQGSRAALRAAARRAVEPRVNGRGHALPSPTDAQ